jgi:hypothetical protein
MGVLCIILYIFDAYYLSEGTGGWILRVDTDYVNILIWMIWVIKGDG